MPVIQYKLLESIFILTNAVKVFNEKCICGITVNAAKCQDYAIRSLGIVTVLNPIIGYSKAAEVVKESMKTGKSVKEIIQQWGLLSVDQLDQVLSPISMTELHAKEVSVYTLTFYSLFLMTLQKEGI